MIDSYQEYPRIHKLDIYDWTDFRCFELVEPNQSSDVIIIYNIRIRNIRVESASSICRILRSSGMNDGDTMVRFDDLVVKLTSCFWECLGAGSLDWQHWCVEFVLHLWCGNVDRWDACSLCRVDRAGDWLPLLLFVAKPSVFIHSDSWGKNSLSRSHWQCHWAADDMQS
jgi:hypothetical protein